MTDGTNFHWHTGRRGIRDRVLRAYPEWPSWPRRLRQVLVLVPAYGNGHAGLHQMAEAHGWDVAQVKTLIDSNAEFREALDDLSDTGSYRHAKTLKDNLTRRPVSWDEMKLVYADEAAIGAFMRVEDGQKPTKAEVALLEASGLYEGVGGIAASASSPTKSETPPGSAEDNIDRIWNGYGTESGLPDYDYLSGGWRTNAEEDE